MPVMSRNPINRVREFLLTRDLDALSDAELLSRFAKSRDEDSFTTLVRRHTPLVLGTARRVVSHAADADDVFQAAFFTLSRKAGSVRCEGTLAPWLHRVTFRLAVRARKRSRPLTGEPRPVETTGDPLSQITGRELYSVIDEEVARLSAGLRATIVLCCLQGLTRDEAAARLGWSSATVKRRLAKARAILERRLSARGITLSAALAPVLVAANLPAAAGTHVLGSTVELVSGRSAVPAGVAGLCHSASSLKVVSAVVTAGAVLTAGLVWGLQSRPQTDTPIPPAKTETAKSDDRLAAGMDVHGDPLPPGALVRIGTTRFRHDDWLNHASWSPDGRFVASAAGRTFIVWEAETGRELARQTLSDQDFPPRQKLRPENERFRGLMGLEWSPDGAVLATAFNDSAQFWTLDASAKRLTLRGKTPATGVNYSGMTWLDENRIVTAHGSRLTVNDAPKETTPATLDLPDGRGFQSISAQSGRGLVAVTTVGRPAQLLVFDWTRPRDAPRDLGARGTKVAFSLDGKTLAAATQHPDDVNIMLEIWDTSTWKSRIRIPYARVDDQPAEIRALALSPDGKTLVTGGGDKTLRWWDTTTGQETRKIGPGWIYFNKAAFRPDGKVLMTVSHENHVRLWDVETGKEKAVAAGLAWVVTAATFTPDGQRVYSVSEHTAYAHDAATGRELWRGGEHTDSAVQVAVTPDGRTVVTSSHDGTLIFREADSGKVIRKIENPRHSADLITLSPDGQTVYALGNEGKNDGVILGWDVKTGKALAPAPLPPKPERYAAYSIRYAPDGSGIAVASGTELRVPVFDPIRKELRTSFGPIDGGVRCAEYSPDGRMLAAASLGDSLYVWDTTTGQARSVHKDSGRTTCLAFSPDGRILAVVNSGRQGKKGDAHDPAAIRLLDVYTGQEFHRFRGHTGSVYRLAWTADGRRLLSGSHDSSCLIWDVAAVRHKLPGTTIDAAEAARAVEALGSSAQEAFQAMARLTGSPATAVAALRGELGPVPAADADRVAELIRDLDSKQFATRDRAQAELIRLGDAAEALLRKSLEGKHSPEVRDRIEKVLAELSPLSNRLRQSRALEVLQRMSDPEARKFLTELAAGTDGAWLTREAKASLARLPN